MRITNIDAISALFDRLTTERIKEYNFLNQEKKEEATHQIKVTEEIKIKLSEAFEESFLTNKYEYIGERRTFDEAKLIKDVETVIKKDLKNE